MDERESTYKNRLLLLSLGLFVAICLSACTVTEPPTKYPDCKVRYTNILPPKTRGIALCQVALVRTPDKYGMVCSTTGCKTKLAVKNHECHHIVQQDEIGCIKFMYKYVTDKEFHIRVEKEATGAEQ